MSTPVLARRVGVGVRSLLRAVAVVCIAVVVGVLGASPARAHVVLDDTSPRNGAVLEVPPNGIVLDFAADVEQELTRVELLDASGAQVPLEGYVETPDDSQVVVPVLDPSTLGAGTYVVRYRVTDVDSHVYADAFTFQIGTGTGAQQEVLAAVGGADDADAGLSVLMGVLRFLAFAGVALMLGAWAVALLDRRGAAGLPVLGRVSWVGLGAAAVGTVLLFAAQGALSAGRGIGGMFSASLWADVTSARIGMVLVVRLVLLFVAVAVVLGLSLRSQRVWRVSVAVVSVCLLVSFSLAGHGGTGRLVGLGVLLDGVHLLAGSAWLGGVVVLVTGRRVWLRSGGADAAVADDVDVGSDANSDDDGDVARRFLRIVPVAIALVVVTGVLQTWRVLPRLGALGDGGYGYALIGKVAVLVLVMMLAATVWAVVRRMGVAGSLRLLVAQSVLGVAVLGVSAVLVVQNPVVAPRLEPATVSVGEGSLSVVVTVTPARVGPVDVHVIVSDPSALRPSDSLSLALSLADRGVEDVLVPMAPDGPDHYVAFGVQIPYAGDWQLSLEVTTAAGDVVPLTASVRIEG